MRELVPALADAAAISRLALVIWEWWRARHEQRRQEAEDDKPGRQEWYGR